MGAAAYQLRVIFKSRESKDSGGAAQFSIWSKRYESGGYSRSEINFSDRRNCTLPGRSKYNFLCLRSACERDRERLRERKRNPHESGRILTLPVPHMAEHYSLSLHVTPRAHIDTSTTFRLSPSSFSPPPPFFSLSSPVTQQMLRWY